MNPETETVQYINQENGSTDLKSYTPSIEIERQNVDEEDQDLTDWFNKMIDTLPVGADAITSYVRVRVSGAGVGGTGGDAGSNVTDTLTLGGRGDGEAGTFNVSTRKFTATPASDRALTE